MRKIVYGLPLGLALLVSQPILAQCSNGKVTFKTYSSIEYGGLARAARIEADLKADLTVSCCGNAGSRLSLSNWVVLHADGTKFSEKEPAIWFQLPVEEAIAAWRLLNETGAPQSLSLLVEFRLSETKVGDDSYDQRNLVMFKDDGLVIRVIGKVPTVQIDHESSCNRVAPVSTSGRQRLQINAGSRRIWQLGAA